MRRDFLTLRNMRYVVLIADGMTVGQVARHCGVSPTCVSQNIQRTEDLLNMDIFIRTTRNIDGVTKAGKAVVEQFRGAIQALDGVEQVAA